MGHQRLGKLPTHRYLPDIVRYLVTGGAPTGPLVEQVTEVSRDALKRALRDPVFVEALWLLIRLPQAAASKDFGAALAEIGMGAHPPTSCAELMVAYNNALERVQRRAHAGATDLGDIARQAGAAALAEAVEANMPMWSPNAADVQASVAALRSPEKFGALAHHFHANIVERVIHYYVDRNLHKLVGADRVARSVHDLATYNSAIRRHCMEAALISTLLESEIEIRTPLQWLTKKEVTQKIADAGMADMLAATVSCTRPRSWTVKQKHCGLCSQCIDI